MALGFIRVLFVLLSLVVGFQIGNLFYSIWPYWAFVGMGIGLAISILIVLFENAVGKVSLRGLSATVFGLLFALIVSQFLNNAIELIPDLNPVIASTLKLVLVLILSYLAVIFSLRGRDEFSLIIPYIKFDRRDARDELMILDTSAIIDGRVFDVHQAKFIEGRFVVPRFVLKELQQVADSGEATKRVRGRRGLDLLNRFRKSPEAACYVHEDDFPDLSSVDEKLIKLALLLNAKIVTTDYNLDKLAEFQGVSILNLNELTKSLKPVVLPGEWLEVRLLKEGKEPHQAVGYLDDGTMVVVDNGRRLIGNSVTAAVTSVLQTSAGRMIFAKVDAEKPASK